MGRRKKAESAPPQAKKLRGKAEKPTGKAKKPTGDRTIIIRVPEELGWFFSSEAMEHFMAAKKEVLLALKCMIEHKLETIEKPGKVKALRIEVE